jgi:hypothetical protein
LSQVFLAEYSRIDANEPVWALPEQERNKGILVFGAPCDGKGAEGLAVEGAFAVEEPLFFCGSPGQF